MSFKEDSKKVDAPKGGKSPEISESGGALDFRAEKSDAKKSEILKVIGNAILLRAGDRSPFDPFRRRGNGLDSQVKSYIATLPENQQAALYWFFQREEYIWALMGFPGTGKTEILSKMAVIGTLTGLPLILGATASQGGADVLAIRVASQSYYQDIGPGAVVRLFPLDIKCGAFEGALEENIHGKVEVPVTDTTGLLIFFLRRLLDKPEPKKTEANYLSLFEIVIQRLELRNPTSNARRTFDAVVAQDCTEKNRRAWKGLWRRTTHAILMNAKVIVTTHRQASEPDLLRYLQRASVLLCDEADSIVATVVNSTMAVALAELVVVAGNKPMAGDGGRS